ncbi:hypothetical protein WG66_006103, partial [Moniliophthora roreri]
MQKGTYSLIRLGDIALQYDTSIPFGFLTDQIPKR